MLKVRTLETGLNQALLFQKKIGGQKSEVYDDSSI